MEMSVLNTVVSTTAIGKKCKCEKTNTYRV